MITGELKSKVDRIWDTMWSGGISNPLSVIEQLTYLLFIKRLDEVQTLRENKSARTGKAVEDPICGPRQQQLRWSRFKETCRDPMRGRQDDMPRPCVVAPGHDEKYIAVHSS